MTEENKKSENEEKQPQSSEKDESQSDLKSLQEKIAKLEEENKRIREEKLESKTSPSQFQKMQEERKRQREAKILNTQLPKNVRLSKDQMEEMSTKDIIAYIDRAAENVYKSVTRDKVLPMYNMSKEQAAQSKLSNLDKVYPDWQKFGQTMERIALADENDDEIQVLRMAMVKEGDWDALEKLKQNLEGKKEEPKVEKPKEEKPKEEKKQREYVTGIGEKPTVSIGNVKAPSKPMNSREAAKKAFEQVFENQGG